MRSFGAFADAFHAGNAAATCALSPGTGTAVKGRASANYPNWSTFAFRRRHLQISHYTVLDGSWPCSWQTPGWREYKLEAGRAKFGDRDTLITSSSSDHITSGSTHMPQLSTRLAVALPPPPPPPPPPAPT